MAEKASEEAGAAKFYDGERYPRGNAADVAEREKRCDLSLTSWTLADVYGRPRMAPRAGF
jgi:hypothetical protein